MQVNLQFKDKELKELLKTLVIIIDTREQENSHITDYFKNRNINYITEKLDYGDYTCMLPKNLDYGITRDIYFHNNIIIERKGSLEELSGNLTKDRNRIEDEFTRAKGKIILMVENAAYEDIINHNYKTKYEPKAFIASLKAYEARYNLFSSFVQKKYTGQYIYLTLYYFAREILIK